MSKRILLLVVLIALAAALAPAREAQAAGEWQASYWSNTGFSGTPFVQRAESAINYDWGLGAPIAGMPKDYFSVRWQRDVYFEAGTYRFYAVSDDGMRVWVDNSLIIHDWEPHAVRTVSVDFTVTKGVHRVVVQYVEQTGGAIAQSWWEPAPAAGGWQAEYFNGASLASKPVVVRTDPAVDFMWGQSAPASGVTADNFAARWLRTADFSAGWYRFTLTADDGARLWVNNVLVIDAWKDQPAQTYTADVQLPAGAVPILLEYYERTGDARVKLTWDSAIGPAQGSAIVIDNGDPVFQQGGPSSDWASLAAGYNNTMLRTRNSDSEDRSYNWARWYADSANGTYEVFVFIPASESLTTHARYWVRHAGGYRKVIVDQAANAGRWVSLGTFRFGGASTSIREFVSLSDVTDVEANATRYVVFDAVQLVPR